MSRRGKKARRGRKEEEIKKNIINKNKELLSLNKQLKEENDFLKNKNNELLEEKTGYKIEINALKKQETIQNSNLNNGNKNIAETKEKKNNVLGVDLISLHSDSIPPKKDSKSYMIK